MIKYLAGKEKRLMKDVNHCVSKAIIRFAVENGVSVIGLENLTVIRYRTNNNLKKTQKISLYISIIVRLFANYNNSLSVKQRFRG
jgi:hypothetical protein